jgi:hypothetical protein
MDEQDVKYMEANGFKVKQFGREQYFEKGDVNVWLIGDRNRGVMIWQTARLIDNHYCQHKPMDTLEEVVAAYKDSN